MTKEEAIELLKQHKMESEEDYWLRRAEALGLAIEALENQKTGHWIENAPEWQNIDPPYICSECGNFHLRKTNYCDQCGVKMN